MMNKGRENNKALIKPPSNDLLVCFPTRAHLTLMPKPTYSPSRPNSEPSKRHNHHLKRINTRAATSYGGGCPNSPLIWAKDNQIRGGGPEMSEPTSPKVTCAGQIKVRPRSSSSSTSCRNWQSVMEEIEKIHNSSKQKKKSSLVETFGFKKDVMSFLTCLRNVRFDFRCFGSFPQHDLSSDDEEEDEEDDDTYEEEDSFKEIVDEDYKVNNNGINDNDDNSNNAVFSKWFMVLQENKGDDTTKCVQEELKNDDSTPAIPPPNALLLMRCRSAPAKGWLLDEKENEVKDDNEEESEEEKVEEKEEINKKKRETLAIVMKYDTDFYKLSNDVAQETWVVGEFKDTFSRSRSCRR